MIARARAPAAAGHAVAAVVPEGEPGRSADPVPRRCSSTTLPLSQVDEYAETVHRAAHLDGQRRRAGQRLRRAEVRGAHRPRSAPARGAPASASTRSRRRSPAANVNLPTGTLYGPQRNFVVQTERPADARRRLPADRRRLPQRQPGPARAKSRNVYDGVENDKTASWYNGTPHASTSPIQRQPGTNTVAGRRRDQGAAAAASARSCRRRCTLDIRSDRSVSIRESVHDVKFTLLLTVVPRRAGDLPLPAEPLGDDHPQPRAAGLDRRHLRGDVPRSATASTTCR